MFERNRTYFSSKSPSIDPYRCHSIDDTYRGQHSSDDDTVSPVQDIEPVYTGYAALNNYAIASSSGTTVRFTLLGYDMSMTHPFKGLKTGKMSGCRLRVVISTQHDGETQLYYDGEAILNGWTEHHASGMTVVIRLEDRYNNKDTHPLTGLETGKTTGDHVYIACWAISDDETLEDARLARLKARPWHSLDATTQSNIKCNDTHFQRWCRDVYQQILPDQIEGIDTTLRDSQFASDVVRRYCRVESRRILRFDTKEGVEAKQRWIALLRLYENRY